MLTSNNYFCLQIGTILNVLFDKPNTLQKDSQFFKSKNFYFYFYNKYDIYDIFY